MPPWRPRRNKRSQKRRSVHRRSLFASFFAASLATACGGAAGLVLKTPAVDKCEAAALKGCPELVDGVLLYVDGDDKNAAIAKIKDGAAKNSPEQLRQFATSLKDLTKISGASSFAGPINEVTALLGLEPGGAQNAKQAAAAERQSGRLLEATLDDFRGGTIFPSVNPKAGPCPVVSPLDKDPNPTIGTCIRAALGPVVLSNLYAPGGCPYDMFVMSGTKLDGDGWYVLVPANSAMSIQGALLVNDSESLIVGAHVPAESAGRFDPHCSVTWAGKKVK